MDNIILMWPPGSGKTTIAKMLSMKLNIVAFDIDDDHLEREWGMAVGEKLAEVWDEQFLKLEGETMFGLSKKNTIIALTWSNPLHVKAMEHIRKMWKVIYLDTKRTVILNRLHRMKVDRIVWMWSKTLDEILDYRDDFYENAYDRRVMFVKDWEIEEKAEKVIRVIKQSEQFVSTRWFFDNNDDFISVVRKWIADDWWLFVPRELPFLDERDMRYLKKFDYKKRALRVLEKFPLGSLSPQELATMINDSYSEANFWLDKVIPTKKLNNDQYFIEIFHWPTAAFKDAALQLTPKLFSRSIKDSKENYLILAATSWDTWVAAIEWYKKEKWLKVVVLYPKDWVSEVQKMQMLSSVWDNVKVIGVDANFDFCQTSIKKIFNDKPFQDKLFDSSKTKLSSANSINWWRLLPQVVYHVSSYLDLVTQWRIEIWNDVDVCVPTWNFWNLLSAFMAAKMWLPINRFICASNDNNVLTEFINTGVYDLRNRDIIKTSSPSIDILKASNIERVLFFLSGWDLSQVKSYMESLEKDSYFEINEDLKQVLRSRFKAWYCSDEESLLEIKRTYDKTWYLMDTHTSVAKFVADKFQEKRPILISSTAHWSKFPQAILKALWWDPSWKDVNTLFDEIVALAPEASVHPQLVDIQNREILHKDTCGKDIEKIKEKILEFAKE